MSSYLPEEMVSEILVRLAIKPLLRMGSVCKTWYNLISSSPFVYAHLNFTKLIENRTRNLIVYDKKYDQNGKTHFKRHYDLCFEGKGGSLEKYQTFQFTGDKSHIISCCNGVVCLPQKEVVILWNPMIGRFLHLPKSNVESRPGWDCYTFGFVFDPVKNDYKVLRIYTGLCEDTSLIEIFRLSNGLWEVLTEGLDIYCESNDKKQVDLEGIAHWFGEVNGELKIVTFDAHEEVFGSIGLRRSGPALKMYLFVFEKSLFFIEHLAPTFRTNQTFCVWRMNEYGIVESWTRLHTFIFKRLMRPLGIRMNGEILWRTPSGELFSTNLEDGLRKDLSTFETAYCVACWYYEESLVLLNHPLSNTAPVSTFEESIIL